MKTLYHGGPLVAVAAIVGVAESLDNNWRLGVYLAYVIIGITMHHVAVVLLNRKENKNEQLR